MELEYTETGGTSLIGWAILLIVKALHGLRWRLKLGRRYVTVFAFDETTGKPALDVEHVPVDGEPKHPDHHGHVRWPRTMLGMTVSIREIGNQRELRTYTIEDAGGKALRVPIRR